VNDHTQWKTIPGGCSRSLLPSRNPCRIRIYTGADICAVTRDGQGVSLHFAGDRPVRRFDHVVFATHGNQALTLLADATEKERDVMGTFRTSRNDVVLHTDETLLPRREAPALRGITFCTWMIAMARGPVTMTYHMNRLQSLPTREKLLRHA